MPRETGKNSKSKRVGPAPARGASGDSPLTPALREAVFASLAACLEVGELEDALLRALTGSLPAVTAIARVGVDPIPSRIARGGVTRAWRAEDAAPRILASTIGRQDERLGFIGYVHDPALEDSERLVQALLSEVATLAVIPARNALRYETALQLAYKDALTGLYNRRALADHLEREEHRAARRRGPLSVLLLDLDRLKEINDCWGHETGDRALCALAEVLERAVRRGDIVARVGGDEFVILLPETAADEARRIGERVQRELAGRRIPCGPGAAMLDLGVSFGVTDLAAAGGSQSRMMELADIELFVAKRSRGAGADQANAPLAALPTLGGASRETSQ